MANFFAFIFAVAMAVLVMEIFSPLIFGKKRSEAQRRTDDVRVKDDSEAETKIYKRNTLEALVLVFWPSRFDPNRASDRDTIDGLLQRSGYYYSTVGSCIARFCFIPGRWRRNGRANVHDENGPSWSFNGSVIDL
jgi:hypothetical protein